MHKTIIWEVIHWEKLWRKLGFPTANVSYDSNELDNSVFYINIIIDENIYRWMWSNMVWKKTFEAHIFDFDNDIYGKIIEIVILKKVRDNKRFDSLEDLISQIQDDKEFVQSHELIVLTFWSFDVTHEWHSHYLMSAKKYGTKLYTIIASDANIEKIKWRAPKHSQQQRLKEIKGLNISDKVILWSDDKPLGWIEKFSPHSICLWYDQRWPFVDALQSEIQRLWLSSSIVRIDAHKPDIYKSSLLKKSRN